MRRARFADDVTLVAFARAARGLLVPDGRAAWVFLAEREAILTRVLSEAGTGVNRRKPVVPRPGRPAKLVLLEAAPDFDGQVHDETSLVLYGPHGRAYTPQALAFCPFLACNDPKRAV